MNDFEHVTQAGLEARRPAQQAFAAPAKPKRSAPRRKLYTPQFSEMATISVRRLAWALGKNMPAAVDHMVQLLLTAYEPAAICIHCQDQSKCKKCVFSQQGAEPPRIAL
jgi:hypothetical protein